MAAVIERPQPAPETRARPSNFRDALRSEWTKLTTVRSTFWSLFVAAALGIGLGALISWAGANRYNRDPGLHFEWNATDHSLRSLTIAQLAFAILGVLIISGEYSTGMIRTSLAAVAKRSRMLSARAAGADGRRPNSAAASAVRMERVRAVARRITWSSSSGCSGRCRRGCRARS